MQTYSPTLPALSGKQEDGIMWTEHQPCRIKTGLDEEILSYKCCAALKREDKQPCDPLDPVREVNYEGDCTKHDRSARKFEEDCAKELEKAKAELEQIKAKLEEPIAELE